MGETQANTTSAAGISDFEGIRYPWDDPREASQNLALIHPGGGSGLRFLIEAPGGCRIGIAVEGDRTIRPRRAIIEVQLGVGDRRTRADISDVTVAIATHRPVQAAIDVDAIDDPVCAIVDVHVA